MDNLEFLFAGFAVFWAGLFVYLVLLQIRIRGLQREVERLEERLAERERQAAGAAPDTTTEARERQGAEAGA
jgi:CcmD family protein